MPAIDFNYKATRLLKDLNSVAKSQQALSTNSAAVPAVGSARPQSASMGSELLVKLMIHARPEHVHASSSVASKPMRKKRLSFLGFKSFGENCGVQGLTKALIHKMTLALP
jgi:hypothetical protein